MSKEIPEYLPIGARLKLIFNQMRCVITVGFFHTRFPEKAFFKIDWRTRSARLRLISTDRFNFFGDRKIAFNFLNNQSLFR